MSHAPTLWITYRGCGCQSCQPKSLAPVLKMQSLVLLSFGSLQFNFYSGLLQIPLTFSFKENDCYPQGEHLSYQTKSGCVLAWVFCFFFHIYEEVLDFFSRKTAPKESNYLEKQLRVRAGYLLADVLINKPDWPLQVDRPY